MTNSPKNPVIVYRDAAELSALFDSSHVQTILSSCTIRVTAKRTFSPSKLGHPDTLAEWGEIFTDDTGIRASVFYYAHSVVKSTRSVKRIVTEQFDYRLPMPNATPRNLIEASKKQKK